LFVGFTLSLSQSQSFRPTIKAPKTATAQPVSDLLDSADCMESTWKAAARNAFTPKTRKAPAGATALGALGFCGEGFAVGIVGYCRLVMLGGLGLFAFQESNVPRNRPRKVAQYAKTKVSQKKHKKQPRKPEPKKPETKAELANHNCY
jgi:hypothetical protein